MFLIIIVDGIGPPRAMLSGAIARFVLGGAVSSSVIEWLIRR